MLYYNPLDSFCKSRIGAVSADTKLMFRIFCDSNECFLIVKKDEENTEKRFNMNRRDGFFETELQFDVGLYWYYFETNDGAKIGLGDDYKGVYSDFPDKFQLTVYENEYIVPQWLKGGIIYQIFPDRFYKSQDPKSFPSNKIYHNNWSDNPIYKPNEFGQVMNNDFFGGNLKGITEKLDYLESLGVTAIYLNPIFEAFSNHRYDTGDYMKIDSLLGDELDLKNLIEKAEEKGIKIILDGVFNHTGDDSVYFNKYGKYNSVGAYQSENSLYRSWYKFIKYPDIYESWWGITTLPALEKQSAEYIDFISGKNGVIEKYTKLGIGGWRLDVVDELPENFVVALRKAVKRTNDQAIIIGEVWEDASNKIAYGVRRKYFQGKELDSVMNYPLKNAIIQYVKNGNEKQLSFVIKEQIDHYPKQVLDSLMNILATHDTYRLISALGGINAYGKSKEEQESLKLSGQDYFVAKNKVKLASVIQYTLYGVPSVYYGDEIGMQGYSDPLNRKTYKWGEEDSDLQEFFVKIGKIRRGYSVFNGGEFKELYAKNGTYIFKRFNDDCEVMVAVNCGEEVLVKFEGVLFELFTEKYYNGEFTLKNNSFMILINKV